MNGKDFVLQNNSALRAIAILLRYYDPKNAEQAYASDVILENYNSIIQLTTKIHRKKSIAKDDQDIATLKDKLERMLIFIDEQMKTKKWKYVAGDNLRSADFVLFYLYG
jgi:hypothetical protein